MYALKKRLKYYGENTNLHGLRYVADEKRHFLIRYRWSLERQNSERLFCRIFWALIFVLSFAGMLIIFKGQ